MTCPNQPTSADTSETTRQLILSAAEDESLLQYLSAIRFDAMEPISEALAEAHNTGDVDLLNSFRYEELNADGPHTFHKVLELFRRTLPLIDCDVSDALATVNSVNKRLTDAGVSATAHQALQGWLKKRRRPGRGSPFTHPARQCPRRRRIARSAHRRRGSRPGPFHHPSPHTLSGRVPGDKRGRPVRPRADRATRQRYPRRPCPRAPRKGRHCRRFRWRNRTRRRVGPVSFGESPGSTGS